MGVMQIGRWGNSLAVRLPRDLAERYDLKEGGVLRTDGIEADLEAERKQRDRERRLAAIKRLNEAAIVLPPDWKFDREEANWRPAIDRW